MSAQLSSFCVCSSGLRSVCPYVDSPSVSRPSTPLPTHGVQPDISHLLAYRFFEPIYYQDDDGFPNSGEKLGYVLCINEHVGSYMTYDILTDDTQQVIPRSVL